jgi:glycosyltransferase involved in cell wall biosynthesis
VIRQTEKALWLARNTSIEFSKGEFLALTEDDVRIPNDWLKNHLKAIDYFNIDISAGIFFRNDGKNDIECKYDSTFKLSHMFPTGNALLKKEVFEKVGLFDRQFEKQRMGDGEFGLRALLNGFNIISNPLAFIIDIKAPTGGLRQMGSWDALRPTSIFAPRPVPSVLYFCKKYFNNSSAFIYLFNNIPQSYLPYKLKHHRKAKYTIYFLTPFWIFFALMSVSRSWLISNRMLSNSK